MSTIQEISLQICDIGRRLYQQGMVVARDGNISYRLNDQEIVCTPTECCKGRLNPDDLCCVTLAGVQIGGKRRPSSELSLHLEVFRQLPEVRAVLHSHPPHALAYSLTHNALPRFILPEAEVVLGHVPIIPYETPATAELARRVVPFLGQASALILAQHGAVTFSKSLEVAFWTTEVLDYFCRVLILAAPLGSCSEIPTEKRAELARQRSMFV